MQSFRFFESSGWIWRHSLGNTFAFFNSIVCRVFTKWTLIFDVVVSCHISVLKLISFNIRHPRPNSQETRRKLTRLGGSPIEYFLLLVISYVFSETKIKACCLLLLFLFVSPNYSTAAVLVFFLSPNLLEYPDSPRKRGFFMKMSLCLGVKFPKHLMMWYNWSMSESPGNKGSPVNISAIKQPIAQMSTGLTKRKKRFFDGSSD